MSALTALFENFAVLFMESAPWLLLGLLIAGLMHELVPVDILKKHMGNASTKAIGKAAVIGALVLQYTNASSTDNRTSQLL